MPKSIRVPVPAEGTDLVLYFDEQVENDQFGLTLDYGVRELDERAQIDEVRISNVEISASGVEVFYEIDWSAHYGCSDMNFADTEERSVRGVLDDGVWIFTENVPLPMRDTVDEF